MPDMEGNKCDEETSDETDYLTSSGNDSDASGLFRTGGGVDLP